MEFTEALENFYNEIYKPHLQTRENAFLYCIAARKKYLKENDECKLSTRSDIIERGNKQYRKAPYFSYYD